MKNYIKLTLVILIAMVISSCAALRTPDMTKVTIGMTKQETIAAMRKKPENIIGAKKYQDGGIMEVLQYTTSQSLGEYQTSWFYFYNDKLVQYGKPTGNWIIAADNVAEEQHQAANN